MGKTTDKRVRVKVIKHLPSGLSVELEDGWHGIIHKGEISWDQEKRLNWRNLYPIGFETWAVPMEIKSGYLPEYSLRLAENNPWDNISDHFRQDKIFVGVVTGVMEYGAFIKLASGITGLLHESQLPSWVKKQPLKIFWPGDRVKVVIKQVDQKNQKLSLGLPAEKAFPDEDKVQSISVPSGVLPKVKIDELIRDKANKKRIVVVEDDPKQASLVSNWLRRVGQKVNIANSAEKAFQVIDQVSPDIALIDVELPGMDGITLAYHLSEKYPKTKLVVTTDYTSADKKIKELEKLQERGVDFLPKPLKPDDLLDFLKENGKHDKEIQTAQQEVSSAIGENLAKTEDNLTNSLHELLRKGRIRLDYEATILFRLDPVRRTVSIAEFSSQSSLNEFALQSLIYSPVRDAAEDEEVILQEKMMKVDEARFQYLLELFPLQACIGVPIPTNLPQKYSLFFLSEHPKEIYDEDLVYVEAISLTVKAYLEQALFKEKYTSLQRSALIGQLTSAVIHETNNLIGPISSRLELFTDNLKNLIEGNLSTGKIASLKSQLSKLQRDTDKIVSTMRMLARTIAKDQEEVLRLDEIINEAISLIQDTSDQGNVKIIFTAPEKLLVVRSQSAALQQILLNLLLNATQQISEFRPDGRGVVQISLEADEVSSQNSSIRISINDNGPGIHASLWETIFELGYSTRKDGSGIGLFISKSLAEEKLMGHLFVKESYILGGTTVTLKIPQQF